MSAILDQWVGETTRTYVIPLFGVLVAMMLGRMVREWRRAPLPPGPRGLPFVGNVRDWPEIGDQPKVFAEWAKKYGEYPILSRSFAFFSTAFRPGCARLRYGTTLRPPQHLDCRPRSYD